jgi:hypothetical protein
VHSRGDSLRRGRPSALQVHGTELTIWHRHVSRSEELTQVSARQQSRGWSKWCEKWIMTTEHTRAPLSVSAGGPVTIDNEASTNLLEFKYQVRNQSRFSLVWRGYYLLPAV